MISIMLNWIYVLITCFCLGIGVSRISDRLFQYRIKRVDAILVSGLVTATVYAQFFSLFYKVSAVANIILLAVCIVICCLEVPRIKEIIAEAKNVSLVKWALVALLFVLWAYFTSRGYFHYDSDLYHGQSIRWIEEYGIVKGLGNIHYRFAYNSSFFALSALYSMPYIFGDSMHAMSGIFAFVLSLTCLSVGADWKNRFLTMSNMAKVVAIYYLLTIIDEVVAPASDYSVMCMVFFVSIRWMECLEQKSEEVGAYAMLCVLGVYAITIKFTAGLLLVLLIKPAYMLIKERRIKQIVCYLSLGILVAAPWMIRGVLISGWLLYPLTAIDIFSVDWKIPAAVAESDAAAIRVWGRALYDTAKINLPIHEWFPNWFKTTLSSMEKIITLLDGGAIVVAMVSGIYILIKRAWHYLDKFLVVLTMICCYCFWFSNAPLIRYGYAYALLLIAASFMFFNEMFCDLFFVEKRAKWRLRINILTFAFVTVYGVYKLFMMGQYIGSTAYMDYYEKAQNYGTYEMEYYTVGGEGFYYCPVDDRTGYAYFPSTSGKVEFELRGKTLKDGFKSK